MIPPLRGAVQYSSAGFRRFLDDILMHGLEVIGLYYGVYRAKVISRDDPNAAGSPDPQGRLTVQIPAVDGTSARITRLAYPMAPLAGPDYGFKSLPPVHTDERPSMVYIVFERGKVEAPLWWGGWWRGDELPEDLQPADANGWFTPGGHQILLDDQDGQEVIRIKHSDGETRIEMDAQGSIFIVNKQGQKVHIGDGADSADEPAALGNTLKGLLENLIDEIIALKVPTPAGLSDVPINVVRFQSIRGQLRTMLSQTVNVK
jgi:hypothetical protein